MQDLYLQYVAHMQKKADVDFSIAVLSWDKEVNLPTKGATARSQQVATLSGISHELFTDEKFGELLEKLHTNKGQLNDKQARNVELSFKKYLQTKKKTTEFVIRSSKVISTAYHAWLEARQQNDYAVFEKALADIIEIKKEEAELLGYKDHPYDAMLELYEPDCRVKDLDLLFKDVREQLVLFAKQLHEAPQVDDGFLFKNFDKDKQWQYGLDVLKDMGYDFEAGRQDLSPHPFTINFSANDVRVTTRIDEHNFGNMTWSCIHEGGHALYEQGLPMQEYGLPLGEYISLGIHESQSRLWENNVARGLPYWKANYKKLQQLFPDNLASLPLDVFYKGINKIAPSLIRTESDEVHYHFHILIRYEIEKGLMEGSISTKDLNKVWNAKYKEYLGVDVPDDNQGILQDIHWAHGSIGYFPTYSLGSFYAAQFFHQAQKDIPHLVDEIKKGNTTPLLDWLREKVHQHGKFYTAEQLCKKITGEKLNFRYFMDYAKAKYNEVYGVVV